MAGRCSEASLVGRHVSGRRGWLFAVGVNPCRRSAALEDDATSRISGSKPRREQGTQCKNNDAQHKNRLRPKIPTNHPLPERRMMAFRNQ